MKKLVFYVVMTFCGLLNVSAGCSEKKDKAPEPVNSVLLGYWKLDSGYSEWKKRGGGDWEKKATIKPGTTAYEFFADKTFISHDLTGKVPAVKGTWKIDVKSMDGKEIGQAYLNLYSEIFKEIAGTNALDKDGSMRFLISTETTGGVGQLEMTTKEVDIEDDERYTNLRNYFVFKKEK
jgi:hypothetical protein